MDMYGIDVGYGFTKIVAPTGLRASFPSVCKPSGGDGLADLFGSAAALHRLRRMTPGQGYQDWLVGRAALARDGVHPDDALHSVLAWHASLRCAGPHRAGCGRHPPLREQRGRSHA